MTLLEGFLRVRGRVRRSWRSAKHFVSNTKSVHIATETTNKPVSVYHRYLAVKTSQKLKPGCVTTKKRCFDSYFEKVQIVKYVPSGRKYVILENVTLDEVIKNLKETLHTQTHNFNGGRIMKFSVYDTSGKHVSLKRHVDRYRDYDKNYQNTVGNIVLFNGMFFEDDGEVNLSIFSSGKLHTVKTTYGDIKNTHISDIIGLVQPNEATV